MTRKQRHKLLRLAKKHFKQNSNGTIDMNYDRPLLTGEIGVIVRDYRTFKTELLHVWRQDVDIMELTFTKTSKNYSEKEIINYDQSF